MELPLYLTFNEFENHYYDHLEKWFEKYSNTSEVDYLQFLANLYSPFLYYNFANDRLQADATIQIKNCFFPYQEMIGLSFCISCENEKSGRLLKGMNHKFEWKTITMMEYAQYILDRINRHFSVNNSGKRENVLDFINDYQVIASREGAGYCLNYNQHQQTLPFLKAYLPVYGQTVNIAVYRDFIFSVVQIAEFIDQKLKEVQAFEYMIYSKLKSEAKFKVQMNNQFLTICN
ncbi:hypothetical protein PFY12_13175 [Chryseobacterium camelliae]|uniref:Uncharacterized protein n=1 Tax=Chryseobacterium camelliae TaxID=1265445 RepID=A0ABY7QLF1_9FLAO|nr:hypothetical protein [Chryseobacterium camelliae]WBV59984.1 hypothetical protein PFY12_13175 [Chryseobacterium camelliae]